MPEHPFNGTWRSTITRFVGVRRDKALVKLQITEAGQLTMGEFQRLNANGEPVGPAIPLTALTISNEEIILELRSTVGFRLHGFLIPELSSPSLKVVCGLFFLPNDALNVEAREMNLTGQDDGTWTGTNP